MSGKRYWEENKVKGIEMKAMRMMRGVAPSEMPRKVNKYLKYDPDFTVTLKELEDIEKGYYDAPPYILEAYFETLGITGSHMSQFKKILKGELDTFAEDRQLTAHIKKEVRKKYKHRCNRCSSKRNLHFHHIERFSKGGQNTVDNLELLCAKCHTEEHKGERGYGLLKSRL
jgi:hypothetical protein